MKQTTIKVESKEQFHELRSKGIGASEIAAVIGVSKWKTPLELWRDKTGKNERWEGNKYTEAGTLLEPVVAKYFDINSGHRIIKKTEGDYLVIHPTHEYLRCHPDREYFHRHGGRGVLECKTVNYKQVDQENIPLDWFSQLHYQLGILDRDDGSLAWLEWGLNFYYKEYKFDKVFFNYLVNEAGRFWNDHVLKDIPPDPINTQDVLDTFPSHVAGKKLQATNALYDTYMKLGQLKAEVKEKVADISHYSEQIKMAMLDCDSVVYDGEVLCTWKKSKDSIKIDPKKLLNEYPDIYAELHDVRPGSRRLLLKGF